jgi:hypothetical protein
MYIGLIALQRKENPKTILGSAYALRWVKGFLATFDPE